jgi:hypothetical protein
MERKQRIDHRSHSNQREQACAYLSDFVAKIEETDGETTKDYGEVEPGEEGAFVGEEDFGLDARGEGDALPWDWMLDSDFEE